MIGDHSPGGRLTIVLASASPRRLELLSHLGLRIDVRPADIDETELAGEDPVVYVRRLSHQKAMALGDTGDSVVIAADTTVDVDGRILGKPADEDEARLMLELLSDRTHRVHTGVTVRRADAIATDVTTTEVTFVALDSAMLDWYVATREPFGKAGSYAIQGAGGVFVAGVTGSVSNVVGLPLTTVLRLARSIGVSLI